MIHWDKVQLEAQKLIPFKYYQLLIEPLRLERETERKVIISAPSRTVIDKISKEYLAELQNALQEVTSRKYALEFTIGNVKVNNLEKKPKLPESNVNVHSFLIKLRDYLRDNFDFKKNLITGQREYKRKEEKEFRNLALDSDEFNDLYFELKTAHGFEQTNQDNLNRIIFSNQVTTSYHPVKDYYREVEGLYNPKRDKDYVQEWLDCVQVSNKQIGTNLIKKHLLRGIHTVFTDGDFENEDLLLLHGTQKFFKTAFLKTTIPKALKDYYLKGIPKDLKSDKDYYLRVARMYYWNLDDITKLHKRDLAFIKAFLNSGDDVERAAYGEFDTRIKRLATFFATSNVKKILWNTKDGNRRFKILTVSQKINIDKAQALDKNKIHSQLYYEYKTQIAINPKFIHETDKEYEANTINNYNYESENELENAIVQHFNPIKQEEFNKNNPLHVALSASQIKSLLLKINREYNFSDRWIGIQLSELEFVLKRGHLSKSYLIELKNKELLEFLK